MSWRRCRALQAAPTLQAQPVRVRSARVRQRRSRGRAPSCAPRRADCASWVLRCFRLCSPFLVYSLASWATAPPTGYSLERFSLSRNAANPSCPQSVPDLERIELATLLPMLCTHWLSLQCTELAIRHRNIPVLHPVARFDARSSLLWRQCERGSTDYCKLSHALVNCRANAPGGDQLRRAIIRP
jgi:hypothetical protein